MNFIGDFKNWLGSPALLPFLLLTLALVLFTLKFFKFDAKLWLGARSTQAYQRLFRTGYARSAEKEQLTRIGVRNNKYYDIYRVMMEGVIEAFGLPFKVQHFSLAFMICWAFFTLLLLWIQENIITAVFISTPLMLALFVLLVMLAKSRVKARDEATMAFTDLVCPLIGKGTLGAFEECKDAVDKRIQPHITTFLNQVQQQSIPIRVALRGLGTKLGPRFYEFERKAVAFETDEEAGMVESFMDIVETNKIYRLMTLDREELYREKNRDLYGRIGLVALFTIYANMYGDTKHILQDTFIGKLVNSLVVVILLCVFAAMQLKQVGINISEELKRGDPYERV